APYNVVWSNVPPGSYELRAIATDNSNEVSVSTPVHISVLANTNGSPPQILTQPQSQAVFPGDNVTFFVEAIGTEPLSYRWFHDGAPVLSATNRFLTLLNVQPGVAGSYFVRVANAFGAVTSSVAFLQVLIGTNLPPTVALTSPVAGSTFVAPATILLSASASDPGGAVTSVEFFEGTNHIAGDTTAPYSVIWSNVPPGVYNLTAVAIDNSNAVTVSTAFQITVFPPSTSGLTLVSTGSVWKYLDDGSDQGTAWIAPAFDDSTWASGPAQLGYGDGDEATVVGFGPDPANKFVTTYFRRSFAVTSAASITGLTVRLLRDDGGVVYLNGVEVFRSNMPTGPILFNTLAVASVGGADESTFFSADVPPGLLVNGQNVLSVEIHQNATPSSDLSFDLELVAQTSPEPPRIVTQPQSQTVPAGSTVSFNVVATGTPPLIYIWFFQGSRIRVSTNNVLTLFNVQTNQAGRYSVMVSNLFGRVTSSNAFLQVTPLLPTNHPPSFVKGPDITLSESDTPAAYRFEPWATNIRPGPTNESGQALVFIVTNDNPGLFATQPAVEAPGGALTLATASHANGTAHVFVVLMDDGGTANGGIDRSEPQVFAITVLPANTPPVAVASISPLATLFPDQTNLFVISPNNSNALVVLDASASSDAEHDPLQFGWMGDGVLVATGVVATNEFDLGVHDLVLVVDDGRATGTAQVEFEVISAGDAVELIVSKLQSSTLPGWIRRPLVATLTVAAATFDAGNFDIGVHHLRTFQNKVRNRVQPVDPDLAALLTNAAQAIIEAVEPR
ncbi:MAG TPA: immunoglobulin domain-containing protein, partial [Candidatus Saccharimonadales bacterium]|nr:immunoglobulin domain-containing protein [Candidatus Saccharimonadales bacterium]